MISSNKKLYLVIWMQMKAVFHFPGIAIVLFVVSNRRIKENDNLSPPLYYSAFPPQKNTFPEIKPLHRHFYLFSRQWLKKWGKNLFLP